LEKNPVLLEKNSVWIRRQSPQFALLLEKTSQGKCWPAQFVAFGQHSPEMVQMDESSKWLLAARTRNMNFMGFRSVHLKSNGHGSNLQSVQESGSIQAGGGSKSELLLMHMPWLPCLVLPAWFHWFIIDDYQILKALWFEQVALFFIGLG
jgi:hypothetical protein